MGCGASSCRTHVDRGWDMSQIVSSLINLLGSSAPAAATGAASKTPKGDDTTSAAPSQSSRSETTFEPFDPDLAADVGKIFRPLPADGQQFVGRGRNGAKAEDTDEDLGLPPGLSEPKQFVGRGRNGRSNSVEQVPDQQFVGRGRNGRSNSAEQSTEQQFVGRGRNGRSNSVEQVPDQQFVGRGRNGYMPDPEDDERGNEPKQFVGRGRNGRHDGPPPTNVA